MRIEECGMRKREWPQQGTEVFEPFVTRCGWFDRRREGARVQPCVAESELTSAFGFPISTASKCFILTPDPITVPRAVKGSLLLGSSLFFGVFARGVHHQGAHHRACFSNSGTVKADTLFMRMAV